MSAASSKSQASQTSTTTDNKVVAAEGSITATGGSTIISADKDIAQSAINAAVTLGNAGLGLASTTVSQGLTAATDIVDQNAAVTEASRVANNNFAQSVASDAISNLKQNSDSSGVQIVSSLTTAAQYAAIASAVIAVGYIILKHKK